MKEDYQAVVTDTLKAIIDFKSKQKSVWSNVFWYVKVCIFRNGIQYTIHSDKTQMLKKFLRTKQAVQKMPFFSFESSNSSQFYFEFAILIWAEAQSSSF